MYVLNNLFVKTLVRMPGVVTLLGGGGSQMTGGNENLLYYQFVSNSLLTSGEALPDFEGAEWRDFLKRDFSTQEDKNEDEHF